MKHTINVEFEVDHDATTDTWHVGNMSHTPGKWREIAGNSYNGPVTSIIAKALVKYIESLAPPVSVGDKVTGAELIALDRDWTALAVLDRDPKVARASYDLRGIGACETYTVQYIEKKGE